MIKRTHEYFKWELVPTSGKQLRSIYRARVTNGFLIMDPNANVVYVPDSRHHWTPPLKKGDG